MGTPEPEPEAYATVPPAQQGSRDQIAGEEDLQTAATRKRGVAWTPAEHKLFLLGLQKLGKVPPLAGPQTSSREAPAAVDTCLEALLGDWRGISRHYVTTRTPTQVASHAQKHYMRQSNVQKRKRRSSLFDMVPDDDEGQEQTTSTQHGGPAATSQTDAGATSQQAGFPGNQQRTRSGAGGLPPMFPGQQQQQLLQAAMLSPFLANPAAAGNSNMLLAYLMAASNPAMDPGVMHALLFQSAASQAAQQAQSQTAGAQSQAPDQALLQLQQLGMLGAGMGGAMGGGLTGLHHLAALSGLGQPTNPAATAAAATALLAQQQQRAAAAAAAMISQDAARRDAATAYSLAQAAAYHAGAGLPMSYHALAAAAASSRATAVGTSQNAEVPLAPQSEEGEEGMGSDAAPSLPPPAAQACAQAQAARSVSGSGKCPAPEGPMPRSAWRTWHDSIDRMPGGTAAPNALLAVAETAQKQEDSAGDGSKGDRLPGVAGDAETGTVDSQAAVRTAGGGQQLEDSRHGAEVMPRQESAAPKAQDSADDAAHVCQKPSALPVGTDQFAAASFANGKLFRPTATWAHGPEALLPGLTTSSNWSDSTKGTHGSMGHQGSMGASPGGRSAVLSGVHLGSMSGHSMDADAPLFKKFRLTNSVDVSSGFSCQPTLAGS